ncbi:hypothetical protein FXO37_29473 [Capsicum annuum]|nr:hypothetical protein FXO37_29473 [Capsicum annuum]
MDGQEERTIQAFKDMLRDCIFDLGGSWVDHFPLIEFAYNNSYNSSIGMVPFEALYGRRCRSRIGWFKHYVILTPELHASTQPNNHLRMLYLHMMQALKLPLLFLHRVRWIDSVRRLVKAVYGVWLGSWDDLRSTVDWRCPSRLGPDLGRDTLPTTIDISGDRVVGGGSGSGSGAAVGDNGAPLAVFEITNHNFYDHGDFTNFASPSKCSACKCQGCKVDVTVEATTKQNNITIDNPSTAFKDKQKIKFFSPKEWKNYSFEGFNISNKDPKKLTKLIDDYSEWITDGLLKLHASSIPTGLPWHLVDEVYIPINYGDEFHWVLAVVILKERHIQVYDSMSGRRCSRPSSEIKKLAKILPTYLNYLSDELQIPNDGIDDGLCRKIYATLIWKYGEKKAQKPYVGDIKDPR